MRAGEGATLPRAQAPPGRIRRTGAAFTIETRARCRRLPSQPAPRWQPRRSHPWKSTRGNPLLEESAAFRLPPRPPSARDDRGPRPSDCRPQFPHGADPNRVVIVGAPLRPVPGVRAFGLLGIKAHLLDTRMAKAGRPVHRAVRTLIYDILRAAGLRRAGTGRPAGCSRSSLSIRSSTSVRKSCWRWCRRMAGASASSPRRARCSTPARSSLPRASARFQPRRLGAEGCDARGPPGPSQGPGPRSTASSHW